MSDEKKPKGILQPFQPGNREWVKSLDTRLIRKPAELRELMRQGAGKAARALYEMLDSEDERVRIVAAKEILDRGWGKVQAADPEQQEDLANAHLEALKAITAGASARVLSEADRDDALRQIRRLDQIPGGVGVQDVPEDVEDLNDIKDLDDGSG